MHISAMHASILDLPISSLPVLLWSLLVYIFFLESRIHYCRDSYAALIDACQCEGSHIGRVAYLTVTESATIVDGSVTNTVFPESMAWV